jgi:O-antigen/teichoic acid export membrane protein
MIDNKKIVYNSLTYFLFSIISQILNLILIPLYTKNITTDEFGQYNIVTSLQSFLSIFITLGIFSGLMRFMGDTDDKQNNSAICSTNTI